MSTEEVKRFYELMLLIRTKLEKENKNNEIIIRKTLVLSGVETIDGEDTFINAEGGYTYVEILLEQLEPIIKSKFLFQKALQALKNEKKTVDISMLGLIA